MIRMRSIFRSCIFISIFVIGMTSIANSQEQQDQTSMPDTKQNEISDSDALDKQKKIIDKDFDSKLVRVNKFIGDSVINRKGINLGQIEELIIDPVSGRIVYAVLSFGDLIDFNEKIFVIPWKALSFDKEEEILILELTEQELKKAPGFYNY